MMDHFTDGFTLQETAFSDIPLTSKSIMSSEQYSVFPHFATLPIHTYPHRGESNNGPSALLSLQRRERFDHLFYDVLKVIFLFCNTFLCVHPLM